MLTVAKLHDALEGLDANAAVVVGIIDGPRYDAAYADQRAIGGALAAYICCYESKRPWEGPLPADVPGVEELFRAALNPPVAELIAAAKALLEAREDQMVTAREWERLKAAVGGLTP